MENQMDKAFETLKTCDWGTDINVLNPVGEAVVCSHGDPAGRKAMETGLVSALKTEYSRDAKDFGCRKLKESESWSMNIFVATAIVVAAAAVVPNSFSSADEGRRDIPGHLSGLEYRYYEGAWEQGQRALCVALVK